MSLNCPNLSIHILCFSLLTFAGTQAMASHKHPSNWAGTNANFGFILNTGNSNDKNLNFGTNLQYTREKWSENLNLSYQMAYADSVISKSIFNGTENVNYYFSNDKKAFVSGNLNAISDIKSDFRYTLVGSIMYGRTLINTPRWNWNVQAGPGYRFNAAYTGQPNYTRPVAVILTNIQWNIRQWGTLSEKGRLEFGKPYNYYQSVTSLTNKLIGHLALQLSFQVDHYSKIPAIKTMQYLTDTTTMASLVYNF